jgi:hypothetical protein
MQRLSASLSSFSSFSAPIVVFMIGPTIVPRRFPNGNRNCRGVPGVTALDNLQVGSVKVGGVVVRRENLTGPAMADVATQARMAKESFIVLVEGSGMCWVLGACFMGDQDAVDTG